MNNSIFIKSLSTIEELQQVQKMEREIWSMEPIPLHQTLTAIKNGGVILGAYDENTLVGYNYGFPGFVDGHLYLCSHMMGILKPYQKKGLGKALKLMQKEIALKLGYSSIYWTFDPLESINANLNLTKLRGIGAVYIENCYGDLDDSLNQGLPSDRFQVHWNIQSDHVNNVEPQMKKDFDFLDKNSILLHSHINTHGFPELNDHFSIENMDQSSIGYFLPIPENFQTLKRDDISLALDWRLKTREVIQYMLSEAFVAAALHKTDQGVHYYQFVPKKTLNL